MPRPPVLPVLDWKTIFESGLPFDEWLEAAEHEMNRKAMERGVVDQELEPHVEALLGALPRELEDHDQYLGASLPPLYFPP